MPLLRTSWRRDAFACPNNPACCPLLYCHTHTHTHAHIGARWAPNVCWSLPSGCLCSYLPRCCSPSCSLFLARSLSLFGLLGPWRNVATGHFPHARLPFSLPLSLSKSIYRPLSLALWLFCYFGFSAQCCNLWLGVGSDNTAAATSSAALFIVIHAHIYIHVHNIHIYMCIFVCLYVEIVWG